MGSYIKLPPDPTGGGGGGSVNSVTVSTGLADSGTATDPVLSLSGTAIASLAKADSALQGASLTGLAKLTAGVLSAALLLTADITDANVTLAKLSSGVQASLGKADSAVQPSTSPTFTGLTVDTLSGIGHFAAGVLSASPVVTADITDANVTLAKLSAGVQASLGKADSAIQATNVVTNAAAGVLAALTNASGLLKVNDAGTAIVYSTVLQSSATTGGVALTIAQPVSTSGSPNALKVTGGAHTTLAASTEAPSIDLDLSASVQFATGALTTQRTAVIRAATYTAVAASTITNTATLSITGPPVAGTNVTLTNKYALWLEAGDMRIAQATKIVGRNNAGSADLSIIALGVAGTDICSVGNTTGATRIFGPSGSLSLMTGAAAFDLTINASSTDLGTNQLQFRFAGAAASATITQIASATATYTGAPFVLNAQDCSGTTTVTAAKLTLRAGDATGGSGTRTGGALDIRPGTGATANGLFRILDGATVRFSSNGTGIGLYAATPVAQQTVTGSRAAGAALTDLLTKLATLGAIVDGTTA